MGLAEPRGGLRHRRDAGHHRLYAGAEDVLQGPYGRGVEGVSLGDRSLGERAFQEPRMTFKDKVVAITGAAGGIGQSLCRLFLDEGAKIAAIDKKASLDDLAAELNADG